MPPTNAPEEIIEKKASSPIATACLLLSVIAILGAIAFQIAEIAEYRKGNIAPDKQYPGVDKAKKDTDSFKKSVQDLMAQKAPGADAVEETTTPDEPKKDDGAKVEEKKEGDAESTQKADADDAKKADDASKEDADKGKEKPDEASTEEKDGK